MARSGVEHVEGCARDFAAGQSPLQIDDVHGDAFYSIWM